MKKYIFISTLLLSVYFSHSQIVNIPDANFKNTLVNDFCVDADDDGVFESDADINNDGEIQVSEAQAVLKLFIGGNSISNLEGIQSFSNLEWLNCSSNDFSDINLITQNLNLKTLICEHNELSNVDLTSLSNLEEINLHHNLLTSIDVTQNPNLKSLICSSNELVNIDISHNLLLEVLNIFYNNISTLDITDNNLLEVLECGLNLITSLDVTQNLNLKKLWIGDNPISNIDVLQNSLLEHLGIGFNNEMTSLNVSQNFNLISLGCEYTSLTSLDLSQNQNLTGLFCSNSQLTSLDLSQNPNIIDLRCNNIETLRNLNINNGFNAEILIMLAYENPNLNCITVDDPIQANSRGCSMGDPIPGWCKDNWAIYSEECILGIKDFNQKSFTIFPNPTQDILNIDSKVPFDSVKIYSLNGKFLKKSYGSSISISELPMGPYFTKIKAGNKTFIKKFIKN